MTAYRTSYPRTGWPPFWLDCITTSEAAVPESAAAAVNETGIGTGAGLALQSIDGQAPTDTLIRAMPPAPFTSRRRPAPLPGASLMVASGGLTSPVMPLQSPYPAMSLVEAVAPAVPGPSVTGTRNSTDGCPTFPCWP